MSSAILIRWSWLAWLGYALWAGQAAPFQHIERAATGTVVL